VPREGEPDHAARPQHAPELAQHVREVCRIHERHRGVYQTLVLDRAARVVDHAWRDVDPDHLSCGTGAPSGWDEHRAATSSHVQDDVSRPQLGQILLPAWRPAARVGHRSPMIIAAGGAFVHGAHRQKP
jgi:hypothetical protein